MDIGQLIGIEFTFPNQFSILGGEDVLEVLLRNGADVNSKDDNDWTPIHRAAIGNCRHMLIDARLLITLIKTRKTDYAFFSFKFRRRRRCENSSATWC